MSFFALDLSQKDCFSVISVKGYVSADSRDPFTSLIEELLGKGVTNMVFDFSACELINSPGLVIIMDITYRIVDDFNGRLVLTGLDSLKEKSLRIIGVLARAQMAQTVEVGLELLKKK
ncbi:MAG: hypothetical protein HQM08_14240 [Candidatus Riflebacteria bacterium]|nr:hypothetical protein [Candidatus Riflebacteria bacterium]